MKSFKNFKFEKLNMKLIIAIGVAIIIILTAIFIIFRTNLIVNHKKTESNSNSNSSSTSNSTSNDESNSNSDSNSSSNSNPNYDDPEEVTTDTVSEEAKNRTKVVSKLNTAEKLYILEENMEADISTVEGLKNDCSADSWCGLDVADYDYYTNNYEYGYVVSGCTGTIYFSYDAKTKEWSFNTSEVTCERG